MEILTEIIDLVKEGFYTTIGCLFLFWILPIQKIKKEWIVAVLTRVMVVTVAWLLTWFNNQTMIFDWTKAMWKEGLITLAFSVLFYEFGGKFLVKKWIKNYTKQQLNKITG